MSEFDAVIIGGGPAGGHCARLLARANYRVLLIEQHDNFNRNIFSSAATPLITLEQFNLPQKIVGSFWQNIKIVTSNNNYTWNSSKALGAVLNFAKLRQFLAEEVINHNGEVWLGYRYLKSITNHGTTQVFLKNKNSKEDVIVSTKILVDATGFARAVIYPHKKDKPNFLKGTGIEYLIKVEPEIFHRFAKYLTFFLGYKWMPKGYSWIFPMEDGLLKVGAASIDRQHFQIKHIEPLKYYIQLLITEHLQISNYQVIDIHGSVLEYSSGLNDLYYRDNIVAIGDAVSTVNFLGGEGIRHAMYGAEIAVKYIDLYLQNKLINFASYQQELKQHFKTKWDISEKISRKVYLSYPDSKIDRRVSALTALKAEDLTKMLFEYDFTNTYKIFGNYLLKKISGFLGIK